jgi:hypothetical protein
VGAAIVSGVDAPPVLEPAEHVLDLVPLPLKGLVVVDLDFAGMQGAMARLLRPWGNPSAS